MWKDPWIPGADKYLLQKKETVVDESLPVTTLIQDGRWNVHEIGDSVAPGILRLILQIPISPSRKVDQLVWAGNTNCM